MSEGKASLRFSLSKVSFDNRFVHEYSKNGKKKNIQDHINWYKMCFENAVAKLCNGTEVAFRIVLTAVWFLATLLDFVFC